MKEEWIAYVLKQTLQGLKYFHDQGQVWATTALLLMSGVFYLAFCRVVLAAFILHSTYFSTLPAHFSAVVLHET